ncbi:MAG: endonuclease/exonuclease/phosphatase family protein [Acidobacteriota bacterium]
MIRIVTLNLWQEQGPWQERIALTALRLAALRPDVVCLQEVRQVEGKIPNQAATLAEALGFHHAYETGQPWGGGDEGLAIVSRFPIREHELIALPTTPRESRRICLGAALETGDGVAWVFTTHLAFRLTDGVLREQQVVAVDAFVQERHARGALASILTGDFNAGADADEIRFLRGLTTLEGRRTYYQDAFALCNPGATGHTWCRDNPYTLALEWLEPDRRLDYIFVTPMNRKGAGRIHECRLVCTEPDARGIRCSDHYGVLAEVTLAGT